MKIIRTFCSLIGCIQFFNPSVRILSQEMSYFHTRIRRETHGSEVRLSRQIRESLTDVKKVSCTKECFTFSPLCFAYRF